MNFVLENIQCVTNGNTTRPARLAVSKGKIAAWDDACPPDWPRVSGKGLLLLPGAVDPHTHFDEPGYTHREDFAHGSRGAVAGGVTTVCDMPCTTVPPVTNVAALENKKRVVAPHAYCDFGLWGGVSANALTNPDWRESMDNLWAAGVVAFKTYTLSGMDTFRHLSYAQFRDVLSHAAQLGALVGVHAEDAQIVAEAGARPSGETDAAACAASRPVEAEVEAIRRVGEMAGEVGARLHIVHVSSGSGAEQVARLQKAGVDVTAETCPQYLSFAIDDLCRLGSILKCTPPVRSPEEREKLWSHVGTSVTIFATDHAPCPPEEKHTGDFVTDYGGMPGVELLLPFALTFGYHASRLTLEQIVNLTSTNAAMRFGLFPQKGCLETGADADFALVDLDGSYEIHGSELQSKGKFTPFDGMTFRGQVRQTWLRGTRVFDNRVFAGPAGHFAPAR